MEVKLKEIKGDEFNSLNLKTTRRINSKYWYLLAKQIWIPVQRLASEAWNNSTDVLNKIAIYWIVQIHRVFIGEKQPKDKNAPAMVDHT